MTLTHTLWLKNDTDAAHIQLQRTSTDFRVFLAEMLLRMYSSEW